MTGLLLVCYAGIQQNYRQSLNDPQIQMAEDAAAALNSGVPLNQIVPIGSVARVNIAQSLAPWIAVYDTAGTPLASEGVLDGSPAQPPASVFTNLWDGEAEGFAKETRFSWQPEPGVRQALVIVRFNPKEGLRGFVVAGRNMREVEDRIAKLGSMFFLGWMLLMAATVFAKILEFYFSRNQRI